MEFLLTIAIPTYNRAKYLDLNLKQLESQIHEYKDLIEIIVSNNASPDNTDDIIEKYRKKLTIHYFKNKKNIGMDRNFWQCFKKANGQFVLILSDDDLFLDGALSEIIKTLKIVKNKECGVVFVRTIGYPTDPIFKIPNPDAKTIIYRDNLAYMNRISYAITYISSIILNKSLYNKTIKFEKLFLGSFLSCTVWALSCILNGKTNVCINKILIAGKDKNAGGYRFARVFGANFSLLFDYYSKKGIDTSYFQAIKKHMLIDFFPMALHPLLKENYAKNYEKENYWKTLFPVFKFNLYFWIFTAPLLLIPVKYLDVYRFLRTKAYHQANSLIVSVFTKLNIHV